MPRRRCDLRNEVGYGQSAKGFAGFLKNALTGTKPVVDEAPQSAGKRLYISERNLERGHVPENGYDPRLYDLHYYPGYQSNSSEERPAPNASILLRERFSASRYSLGAGELVYTEDLEVMRFLQDLRYCPMRKDKPGEVLVRELLGKGFSWPVFKPVIDAAADAFNGSISELCESVKASRKSSPPTPMACGTSSKDPWPIPTMRKPLGWVRVAQSMLTAC